MKTYSIMYWLYYNQIFLFLYSNNKFYQDIDRVNLKQPESLWYEINEKYLRLRIKNTFLYNWKNIIRNLIFLTISFCDPNFFCLSC